MHVIGRMYECMLFSYAVVVIGWNSTNYVVTEDSNKAFVCLTKDKETAQNIPLTLFTRETMPPSASGTHEIIIVIVF